MNVEKIKRIVRQMHREASAEMAQAVSWDDERSSTQARMARAIGNFATAIEQALNDNEVTK